MYPVEDPCDVLLVDDSQDALNLLTQALNSAGLRTHTASDGKQALAYLAQHQPEAILLDVLMPGMDGFETCRCIRALNEDVPIIFMTGLGETEHIVRGFAVGGNDYVTKPVSPPEVLARLQAHTRTAQLVRATRDAINATQTALLAIDHQGLLLWCNEAAHHLLTSHAPDLPLMEGHPLPPILAPLSQKDTGLEVIYLYIGAQSLEVRRASDKAEPIHVFLIKPIDNATPQAWTPQQLTARESEVLLWVARGKTNRDIADILGMSPRTVNKHLEHIFEKLGVETRTAAAAAATRQLNLS